MQGAAVLSDRDLQDKFPWARLHSLAYPLRLDELGDVLEIVRSYHCNVRDDRESVGAVDVVAKSASMQEIQQLIAKLAPTKTTVLITGESGTGKEVLAAQLHDLSGRDGPFVAVNCGAIPEQLLESELFGHERGAFTGASSARAGRFEQASGGTLFLDEVGDMPTAMQVKLLRVLEERVVERVGGTQSIPVDVRLVAATHRDLPERIETGDFRADLYYRLSVFPVEIPPLRERRTDIAPLVEVFVDRFRRQRDTSIKISDDAMRALEAYDWPGNVRELANVVERLVVTKVGGTVTAADLPHPLTDPAKELPDVIDMQLHVEGLSVPSAGIDLKEYLGALEKQIIERALDEADGVVQTAAKSLGIGRTTLVEKIRRHKIR
ncbi:MAG: sigma-54 dependent transcriptional regulator [Pseudomonadota bacterium]